MRRSLLRIGLLAATLTTQAVHVRSHPAAVSVTSPTRGMWIWTTQTILSTPATSNAFVAELKRISATQVYLYLIPSQINPANLALRNLIAALTAANIRIYAMDGYRGYFDDVDGPSILYQGVDAMIAYNAAVPTPEHFVGYMLDMEPQDGQGVGPDAFHNSLAESKLSLAQRVDRDKLMGNWLSIHETVKNKIAPLRLASSVPSWTDNYYGEPVLATFGGHTADVTRFLMKFIDDYCIMSYNTDPLNAVSRVVTKLQYADTLVHPPRVSAAIETDIGPGPTVSYGDTPPKNNKEAVINDADVIFTALASHQAFAGVHLHDWEGWQNLPVEVIPFVPATRASGWIP